MKLGAKLIHRTYMSYLPTAFPAHYYGMPNGKVYFVFSRFYEQGIGDSGLEFVFAEHEEFTYDYSREEVVPTGLKKKYNLNYAEQIDKPDPKYNVLNIKRDVLSYGEAQTFLNEEAKKMLAIA